MAKRSLLVPQPDPDDVAECRHALQSAVYSAISEGDVAEIVRGLVARAKDGDAKAAALVLGQLVGTPRGGGSVTQQVAIVAPRDGGPCRLPPDPNIHRIVEQDSTPPAELARRRKAGA